MWALRRLRTELASAATNWTVAGDLAVVRPNPRERRVTKPLKPCLVVINRAHRCNSLRNPESQIRMATRKLVNMLRGEPPDLLSNELGPSDRVWLRGRHEAVAIVAAGLANDRGVQRRAGRRPVRCNAMLAGAYASRVGCAPVMMILLSPNAATNSRRPPRAEMYR